MDRWRFDPADYKVGGILHVAEGPWSYSKVDEYIVTKVTPSGQVVGICQLREDYALTIRVNKYGNIVGNSCLRRSVVGAEQAAELLAEVRRREAWNEVRNASDEVEAAARRQQREPLDQAVEKLTAKIKALPL